MQAPYLVSVSNAFPPRGAKRSNVGSNVGETHERLHTQLYAGNDRAAQSSNLNVRRARSAASQKPRASPCHLKTESEETQGHPM